MLVFLGEYFIPEQCTTLPQNSHNCNLIYSARADNYTDQMRGEYGPSRHFTVVFNALVWMQLFNEINSRKIKNELNVCSGLSRNILFLGVWISTAFAQVMLVEFSGHLFSVSRTVSIIPQLFRDLARDSGCSALHWVWVAWLSDSSLFHFTKYVAEVEIMNRR